MRKSFKVAGHAFCFCIPEGHSLWGKLGQYAPFEVAEAENPIFELEITESLPELPTNEVYAGCEGPGEPVIKLYNDENNWAFEMAPCSSVPICGQVLSNKDFTKAQLKLTRAQDALFALNNAAMLMFAFRSSFMDTLEVHASVIVNGGKAFLWMAKSGTGKSTHSKLWLKHIPGSHLLNDDNPIIRVHEGGNVVVYGSPWSGKTPCYKNEHYPAGAFVEIKRSLSNNIIRKNIFESYALLYSSSSGMKNNRVMADGLHSAFEKIATKVPCYTLECRPDEEAAKVSSTELLAL